MTPRWTLFSLPELAKEVHSHSCWLLIYQELLVSCYLWASFLEFWLHSCFVYDNSVCVVDSCMVFLLTLNFAVVLCVVYYCSLFFFFTSQPARSRVFDCSPSCTTVVMMCIILGWCRQKKREEEWLLSLLHALVLLLASIVWCMILLGVVLYVLTTTVHRE